MLQEVVDDVHARMLTDPEFAARYLTEGELRQRAREPVVDQARISGRPLSAAVAERLATDPALSRLRSRHDLSDLAWPLPISEDLSGQPDPQMFDVTSGSPGAIARHQGRSTRDHRARILPAAAARLAFCRLTDIDVPARRRRPERRWSDEHRPVAAWTSAACRTVSGYVISLSVVAFVIASRVARVARRPRAGVVGRLRVTGYPLDQPGGVRAARLALRAPAAR